MTSIGRRMGMDMEEDILLLMLRSIPPNGLTNTYAIAFLISVNLLFLMPMPNKPPLTIDHHHQSSNVKSSLLLQSVSLDQFSLAEL
jgi:hypothetical protein